MTPETKCKWCGEPTRSLATQECDPCHNLAVLIQVQGREVLQRILDGVPLRAEPESQASKHADAGYLNDVRFEDGPDY